jgi:hypothetical protein
MTHAQTAAQFSQRLGSIHQTILSIPCSVGKPKTVFDTPATSVVFCCPKTCVHAYQVSSSLVACVDGFPPLPDPVVPVDLSTMPQQWEDYYNNYCEGNIPDIPQTTLSPPSRGPTYPTGYDPTSSPVCSTVPQPIKRVGWKVTLGTLHMVIWLREPTSKP